MGADEVGTLASLKAVRHKIFDPAIAAHKGRIVKTTGDGLLVEFASAVDAITCAVLVQDRMATHDTGAGSEIGFRIGINVGDIIIEGDDIFGDGVNIAARVENECEPGGVCLSGNAFEQVRGKTSFAFEDLGERSLKNIERPVRLYVARSTSSPTAASVKPTSETARPLSLPDKPSIAVLPFQNMSGDPEQEYFADGMVEELITALSRFKWLFVISRNSSFTFKGKAVDIKDIGHRLGVRYVLEGSVRKASGKVRIGGQLIDALTGTHIWADRFERDLTDIFALQDEVTVAVVSAIQPKLLQTEIRLAARRRPENLTAYDFYLQALQQYYLTTREGVAQAAKLAHRSLELDHRFGLAAALAAACHMQSVLDGFATHPQQEREDAVRLARMALSLDEGDPDTLVVAAVVSAFMVGDCEAEIEMADRAVVLNPNSFLAWNGRGHVCRLAGLSEEAVRSFERAMRLSPIDPLMHSTLTGMSFSLVELGRFDEAIVTAKKALRHNPSYSVAYRCLASALAHLGRDIEAREAADRLLAGDPTFTIAAWISRGGQSKTKLMMEGLRMAGLPE
jgi:adenylate cyclase